MRLAAYLWLVLAGIAAGADGIVPATPFKVPFAVDSVSVTSRASFSLQADGAGILTVHYVKGDSIEQVEYRVVRVDVKPSPKPEPKPEPKPTPPPEPKPVPVPPSELWGIVIEESANRTPEQAEVLVSLQVRGLFPDGKFQIFDPVKEDGTPATPPPDLQPYVARARGKESSWPMLFLVAPNGDVKYEGPMPATVAAMVAKHKEAISAR